MWNLSTGTIKALENKVASIGTIVSGTTISFDASNGTGGRGTIANSANGLDVFDVHDFLVVINPGHANHGALVKVLNVTPGVLEVPINSVISEAVGNQISLMIISAGSLRDIFRNMTIHFYTSSRPTTADDVENGILTTRITLNGAAFTGGISTNGLNFGQYANGIVKRAIDSDTGNVEDWKGTSIADGTINWCRIYDNSLTVGNSTTTCRMDGIVSTTSGDVILSDKIAEIGKEISIIDVIFKVVGTNYVA